MKKRNALITWVSIIATMIVMPLHIQAEESTPGQNISANLKAKVVEYSIRTPIKRRNLRLDISGQKYYVSVKGSDQNPGNKEKPFRNIQRFADIAQPGDVCYVREGTYRETVRPKNGGRSGDPIRYVAYPGEKVTISGTEALEGEWTLFKDSIYKMKVDTVVEQLFVDGEMMIEARWPNMRFDQLWQRSCWATAAYGSDYEKMLDPELAQTGIDWTGAIATLNVAHQFATWTRKVSKHSKGSDTFEYVGNMGKLNNMIGRLNAWSNDYYYLSGKLEALDIPTEWFYDRDSGELYVWTPDGKSPASHSIEVKVRDRAFEVNGVNEIHLIGFQLFACTFQFENTVHSLVDDCHMLFPTYARELGGESSTTSMTGSYNTIRNCSIGYTPLAGLAMKGSYNTLENNLVHDVCWNGSLAYPAIVMSSGDNPPPNEWTPTIVKGNTVYNAGSSGIGFYGQAYLIEYNHVHHAGLLSHDVSAIYTGLPGSAGSTVCYNWVHNCHPEKERGRTIGLGIRTDDQCRNISVHHNVIWDIGLDSIVMKGEYHKVYNNTIFHTEPKFKYANSIRMDTEPEPYKAWRMDTPLFSEQNAHSLVFNNLTGLIRAKWRRDTPFVHRSNVIHNELNFAPDLRDPKNSDFRPKADSSLVDAGIAMPGLTDHYEGQAPDIGAYEHGGINWRPGYRAKRALFYRNNKITDKLTD